MLRLEDKIPLLILAAAGTIFTNTAIAEDDVRWKDIDFGTCPLNAPLRVADTSSTGNYVALGGCAASIVIAPKAPIATGPTVARIVGIKAEKKPAAGKKRSRRAAPATVVPQDAPVEAMRPIAYRTDASYPAYDSHVQATAAAYRIDPLFLHAIIGTESTYAPRAISHAGARGLMQIMPATGARFGVARSALYDPATNIDTGARLLKSLQQRYGRNFNLILAAYNAGEGAVQRYGNAIPPYRETQAYVVKVMNRYAALRGAAYADGGI